MESSIVDSTESTVVNEHEDGEFLAEALRWRERQYATLAEIGLLALRQVDIGALLDIAAKRLREALAADFTKLLDHRAGTTGLLLRAGDGWPEGVVGHREVPEGANSQGGYTLLVGKPIIVDDLATETRFVPPALLLEHGVRSGMSVVIEGDGRVLGVLQADKREPHYFRDADIPVLQAYANVLGGAIAQYEREHMSAEFAVLAAHELRTPLTAVVGFSSRLLRRLDETGQIATSQRDEVEAIYGESLRLRRSIELFLALGDAERRLLKPEHIPIDLSDIAEDVASTVAERFTDHTIVVQPKSESTEYVTDELSIVRILSNLVENGAKYSPPGSVIEIEVDVKDGEAEISVTDACGGMADDDLRRAFQWSFRGNGAGQGREGLGLGLYVAKRLCDRIGADLEADNVAGACRFTLHLHQVEASG